MSKKKMKTCFVIPAFNEEDKIFKIIKKLKKIGEVIVVDDCSKDKTNYLSKKSGAKVIRHLKNYGYDRSLYTGIRNAEKLSFKYIITIDADGQHSTKDAKKILNYLNTGYAIVYGKRQYQQRLMEKIFSIYTIIFKGIADPLCGLKGYNTKICKKYGLLNKKNNIGTRVLFNSKRSKLKTIEVNIFTNARKNKSRYGGLLNGNLKILKIFIITLVNDLMNLFLLKKNI